jgi:aminopeptidase N
MVSNFTRVLYCAALLGFVSAIAAPAVAKPVEKRMVLPSAVTPRHYRLDIIPDAQALTFTGTVAIEITVHQAIDTIVLNSADIVIDSAAVSGESSAPTISYDGKTETAAFALGHKLKPGAYTLSLVYHGKIFQQSSGLFALDYDTPKGKARSLFTQFENSDARRFVPCWDEPGLKATFDLTATVPAEQMAVSNMPVAATDALPGGRKRVHFATSPKMSSYLLFFAAGDFERIHRDVGGVDVGVVVKRGDTTRAAYALTTAAQILPYYNDYFGTPYPLPKLDLIAAPGDSQFFSAMENWGAIMYFEHVLLIDPRLSTDADRQDVYTVVAHEMAHQWFGDLVTMAWWDDLWLNEGFASWMEEKVTDHFHPEWNVWLHAVEEKQGAKDVDPSDGAHPRPSSMDVDARVGTHPIITPIYDVLQASGAFDTITYEKGSAVIQTLEGYLGEDAFRAGVRRYMHDHAYGNTVTDDLWKEMDKGSRRPITRIAHDLTLQAGVPLVSEASVKCVNGNTVLELTQGHFAIDADSTKARVWQVPVTAAAVGGAPAKTVIAGAHPRPLKVAGCAPVILNAGQSGYFRSRYTHDALAAIASQFSALSPYDQLGVFNDTGSLAYLGEEPMAALLELTMKFPADADPLVISALVDRLHGLDRIYRGLPTQPAFRAYAVSVLRPVLARVTWNKAPGESDNLAGVRSDLIAALGDFGDVAVLAEAKKRFEQYVADEASFDAATRSIVLRAAAAHADQATWDQLHGMAKSAKTELERREFYGLLAAAEDTGLAQQALDLAVSGEPPATLGPRLINVVSGRHPEMAFDFAVAHWDKVGPMIEPASEQLYMPRLLRTGFDLKLIAKLDAFAKDRIPASARQGVDKADSLIRYLAKIRQERLPGVDRWVQSQGG